jgi:hypothetical protein
LGVLSGVKICANAVPIAQEVLNLIAELDDFKRSLIPPQRMSELVEWASPSQQTVMALAG